MNEAFAELNRQQLEEVFGKKGLDEFLSELVSDKRQGGSVDDSIDKVRDFHKQISAEISNRPKLLATDKDQCRKACQLLDKTLAELRNLATDNDTLLSRLCLSIEETVEWLQSHIDEDLVAAADAIGDRAYVLFGDAVASGMPLQDIFEEIHRSNMSKAESKKGELGKADKSDGYNTPDLDLILAKAKLNSEGIGMEEAR